MNEIKIQVPEGYEGIDEEASDFANGKIVFKKKKPSAWKESHKRITGYFIDTYSKIQECPEHYIAYSDCSRDNNVFVTEQQAKSALAMAQLGQIMQNDPRFGGPIPPEGWRSKSYRKYIITRKGDDFNCDNWASYYHFLAFRTPQQRDLFLKEYKHLIKDYFMMN